MPSARRATVLVNAAALALRISIHALREEGDSLFSSTSTQTGRISIHALREEGDQVHRRAALASFLISIHALREEGDAESRA